MIIKHSYKLKIFILILLVALISNHSYGQKSVIDPAGYIQKYNKAFIGIGPKIYILPAPRTKKELLVESYQSKINFADTINKELVFQDLLTAFKSTNNDYLARELIASNKLTQEKIKQLVDQNLLDHNYVNAYSLLNEASRLALKERNIELSINLLLDALMHAQKTANGYDMASIQYNLAIVYLFDHQNEKAANHQNQYYEYSLANKIPVEQANSLVQIALIQAFDRDYRAAENTLIRKAIPLFNKNKAYSGKINAWKQLATIYQMQNKHAEAQWFLLQARDLSIEQKLLSEQAEIEYMLASSKLIQKNYKVAQKEFQQAKTLAIAENNKYLELAIQDKIGNIYMLFNDLVNAETSLIDYWTLRKEIFN